MNGTILSQCAYRYKGFPPRGRTKGTCQDHPVWVSWHYPTRRDLQPGPPILGSRSRYLSRSEKERGATRIRRRPPSIVSIGASEHPSSRPSLRCTERPRLGRGGTPQDTACSCSRSAWRTRQHTGPVSFAFRVQRPAAHARLTRASGYDRVFGIDHIPFSLGV